MEYEVALDGVPGEVFVTDRNVITPLGVGAELGGSIAPAGATLATAASQ